MSGEAVNLADGAGYFMRVSGLAAIHPKLFLFVSDLTEVQPLIDKGAGYGPFHAVRTFFELGLTSQEQVDFMNACDVRPWVAYVILRSMEYKFYDQKTFREQLEASCFKVADALDHVRKFLPNFGMVDGRQRLEANVTAYEEKHGNQKAASRP